ncbi:MAG: gamma-glutamyltransferase, partial [Phycisphaerales bacterium]
AVGPDYFENLDEGASVRGGKACAVPGTVAGLLHALDKYGTMKRAQVMAPAILLAREGFTVDEAYAKAARGLIRRFEENPGWREKFGFTWTRFLGEGKVEVGQEIRLPEQAAVLERIAELGTDGFYKGEVAEAVVAAARAAGGEMTLEDLAGFRVTEAEPLRADLVNRTLLLMPPPSSGGLAIAEAVGIMGRLRIAEHVQSGNIGLYYHVMVESFKHAFADRAKFLGDAALVDVPVERLLSKEHLDALAKRVRIGRTSPSEMYGSAEPLPEDGGTSHLCVVDRWGGAVACTETINLSFGSLVSSDRLGFCLNNQMDDFTTRRGSSNAFGLVQSDRNRPAPGKRPLSSMSPTIVLDKDGKVRAVAGASGGPRIITATVQALMNTLVRGHNAAEAVSRPRVHHQWKPAELEVESGFDERHEGLSVESWMRKLGHTVKTPSEGAAVQMIVLRGKRYEAACDPRKGGKPDGE